MAVRVTKAVLWRGDVQNRPGALADRLDSIARAGASLRVVMGYRRPGEHDRAVVEVYPIGTKKAAEAAGAVGLAPAPLPALLVEGDDFPGLGARIARCLSTDGLNMAFLVTQVIGKRYSSVFGFESDEDTRRAAALIRKVAKARPKRRR